MHSPITLVPLHHAGMLSGLYFQSDLNQYVWSYCRNTMAGQVVTQTLPISLTAAIPLNLDGGNGYNSTFPSWVSNAADEGFIPANPNPLSATIVTWCCDTNNCNTGTTPQPPPPSPPPSPPKKGALRSAVQNTWFVSLTSALSVVLLALMSR